MLKLVSTNKHAGIVICIPKTLLGEGKKVDQAQLLCIAAKFFNYSNMLGLRCNLSVRIS